MNNNNDAKPTVEQSRRDFLKKAGKIAIYTPPAMIAMSQPSLAAICESPSGQFQCEYPE